MENANLQYRLRQALYSLRKQYGGGPISIYQASNVETDLVTGIKSNDVNVTVVDQVVVLPTKVTVENINSISKISSNKMFVVGGGFDSRARTFIIDKWDTPDLDEIKLDDWIVFDNNKYELKRIEEFSYAWVIVARQLLGDLKEQVYPLTADNTLGLEDGIDVEP